MEPALRLLQSLAMDQLPDGHLGVTSAESQPGWATSLAILAWQSWRRETAHDQFAGALARARQWLLSVRGDTKAATEAVSHDGTIPGWPWVEGTHSWIEPTAWARLALLSCGDAGHPRARDAARLLLDRLLPTGGCNYGNTIVLGQVLRPHVQPTGLAMLALAGVADASGRAAKSLDYLESAIAPQTTAASLGYALLGLAAHGRFPKPSASLLDAASAGPLERGAPVSLALLLLAAAGARCPLLPRSDARRSRTARAPEHSDGRPRSARAKPAGAIARVPPEPLER
jgi:hypothetical protein